MLLIQSDMIKALWLVTCPIAFFAKVSPDSSSAFCQVSGFFLTVGIEASDLAVLLIAIHTALFILNPQSSKGATGLYPYRRIAYAIWAIVPIIMASVVPMTGGHFENNGPHCYLPIRPTWYRRALSWIPRYIIFIFIITTYLGLYLYITLRYRRLGELQKTTVEAHNHAPNHMHKHKYRFNSSDGISATPPIVDGLLGPALNILAKDGDRKWRPQSLDSATSALNLARPTLTSSRQSKNSQRGLIRWKTVNYSQDYLSDESQGRRPESLSALADPNSPSADAASTIPIRAPEPVHYSSPRSSHQPGHNHLPWKRSMSVGSHSITDSITNMMCALQRGSLRPEGDSETPSSCSVPMSQGEIEEAVHRSREKLQRQLRLLFVYPIIYLLTWIVPFVSHTANYNDEYVIKPSYNGDPPFALQFVSIGSMCIGAAADCCFFSAWEKPWRHLRGGFWECLILRFKIRRPMQRRTGRTREERFVDARTARVRRDQEENLENLGNETTITTGRRVSRRGLQQVFAPREWWDVLDEEDSSETSIAHLV